MPGTFARLASSYRRTAAAGLASAGLVLLGLGPAGGSEARPAAPAPAPFSNGVAKATAVVTRVAPGVGSLELALGSGVAVSELKNQLAQSQAQALDMGLIGTTLTAEGCSGDARVGADDLPQPTRVDNRKGNAEASSDEIPVAGESLGGGREWARATTVPSARSVATTTASDGPAVGVGGGRATAITEVVDGAARQAIATVEADVILGGGAVRLSGLRWEALHRTGKGAKAEAAFDVGTARVAGVPVPVDSLGALQDAINVGLAQTGITVELPRVERVKEPTDLIRVTPLRVALRDSPAGAATIGPGLNATRVQREQLFEELSEAYCDLAGVLLVGDITVSVVAGTGFMIYDIGGAEAISGDFAAVDPFGDPIRPPGGAVPNPPAAGPTARPAVGPVVPPVTGAPPATPSGQQPTASVGPLEELCETVHPFDWPSCSEGAMVPLGLLGLAATAGMGALDWRHQRRRLDDGALPAGAA